jgi:hypothetical protein
VAERPLYPVCRIHIDELADEIGVWQHAIGARPNPAFGYCTDDVARALEVDILHSRILGWSAVEASARRSMAFLAAAFNARQGRFRNFRSRTATLGRCSRWGSPWQMPPIPRLPTKPPASFVRPCLRPAP